MSKTFIPIVLLCALAACGREAPLRIGVVGDSTSALGATLAVEDVNANGGIHGRRLEIRYEDEPRGAQSQDAIAVAESLAADPHVLAVIGHHRSSTSLAAAQVYNARHLPQIAPNTSSPLFTQAGPFSFRLVASDEYQARFIAARVAAMRPTPRVAVLYANDDYGRAMFRAFRWRPAVRTSRSPISRPSSTGTTSPRRSVTSRARSKRRSRPSSFGLAATSS